VNCIALSRPSLTIRALCGANPEKGCQTGGGVSNARPRQPIVAPRGFRGTAPPRARALPPRARSLPFLPERAEGEMQEPKKGFAIEFINRVRTMDAAELNAMIVREAGEDLAQFFLTYSANLISRDPERVIENTSSLMLMGYLIRAAEDRTERRQTLHA
jgi:hypothetical protein